MHTRKESSIVNSDAAVRRSSTTSTISASLKHQDSSAVELLLLEVLEEMDIHSSISGGSDLHGERHVDRPRVEAPPSIRAIKNRVSARLSSQVAPQ